MSLLRRERPRDSGPDQVIDRILYLDGVPNLQRYNPVRVGEDIPEQLALELQTETEAIGRYNNAVALAVAKGDIGTRELLAGRLVDEEAHADWIESQLHVIDTIGVENYRAQQLGD
ncbi:MAG: ferritin-like domain-containing protein [Aquihabitans sp.]